jgi:hypothetical protein
VFKIEVQLNISLSLFLSIQSQARFSTIPTVLVTAEHHRKSLKHDAASVWLEDVGRTSFKVCLRELQNFDGPHQDISVVSFRFSLILNYFNHRFS